MFFPFRFHFLLGFFFSDVLGAGEVVHTSFPTPINIYLRMYYFIREGVSFYMPTTLSPDFRNQPDRGHLGRRLTILVFCFVVFIVILIVIVG
jgi:hypothetical protein